MELIVTDLAVDCRLILGSNAELECVYTRAQLGSSSRQQTQSRMTAVLISAISHQNREGGQGEKKTKNFAVIPTLSQEGPPVVCTAVLICVQAVLSCPIPLAGGYGCPVHKNNNNNKSTKKQTERKSLVRDHLTSTPA